MPEVKLPKIKDLTAILANVEHSLGNKGDPKMFVFGERESNVDIVSFGIPELDAASNLGGCPRGRLIELFGPESGGKSYTTLKLIASFQKAGLPAALIDVEHSFMPAWAASHGVDISRLLYGEDFEYGEEALEYVKSLCISKSVGLIVVDSTTGLSPKSELEGKIEDQQVGVQARMLSRAIRQIVNEASLSNTTVVFINQLREKVGVMFGNPETTPGGRALKFYAHMRIRVQKKALETVKDGDVERPIGIRSELQFVKNKVAMPFGKGEIVIFFNPETNTPILRLAQMAARVKAIPNRKTVQGEKHYMWKDEEGEIIDTDTSSLSDFGEWVAMNGYTKGLLATVQAKIAESKSGEKLDEDVLALGKDPAPASDDKQGALEETAKA